MIAEARKLNRRLADLGAVSDEPRRLVRTFLSPAMRRANQLVGSWMREAGLAVREDAYGNLIGRWESADPSAPTLLMGSHLDTVRDAGRFDGALGVLLPIAAVEVLRRSGRTLPCHLELLGFAEEEGVRFSSSYLGSKGYCGGLRAADLALADGVGTTVREALEGYLGGPVPRPRPDHRPADLLGYVEVHIEQGPVLEARGLGVGVVSAIAGQSRVRITWRGRAGHAGTTPMALRHDALPAAAELVLAAEALARGGRSLVATVGLLTVAHGAANVIPGEVVHTLDVRHPEDDARISALSWLRAEAERIARRRKLELDWRTTQEDGAVTCSRELAARLARSVRNVQGHSLSLPSGAGHDAVILSRLTPVAMLFVRCRGGLSHHPDEHASPRDLATALAVTVDFLEGLGG
jgi:allantoate deiminase